MDDEDRENEGDLCVAAERVTPEHDQLHGDATGAGSSACRSPRSSCDRARPADDGRARTARRSAPRSRSRSTRGAASVAASRRSIAPPRSAPPCATDAGPGDIVTPGPRLPAARAPRRRARARRADRGRGRSRAARRPRARRASSARSCATTARWRGSPTSSASPRSTTSRSPPSPTLIEYRCATTRSCTASPRRGSPTRFGGDFRAVVYTTDIDDGEHLVLVRGDIRPDEPTLVRPHLEYLAGRRLRLRASATPERCCTGRWSGSRTRGAASSSTSAARSAGVDLFAPTPSVADGHRAPASVAALHVFRDFGIGAQILRDVGVGKIRWLTNNPLRLVSLPGYGLEIVEWVPLTAAGEVAAERRPRRPRRGRARRAVAADALGAVFAPSCSRSRSSFRRSRRIRSSPAG